MFILGDSNAVFSNFFQKEKHCLAACNCKKVLNFFAQINFRAIPIYNNNRNLSDFSDGLDLN